MLMKSVKANFRGKRDINTRAFFKENRQIMEGYLELYKSSGNDDKPYDSRCLGNIETYHDVEPSSPKHVYKLMGSLYQETKTLTPPSPKQ